jgi:hypothetical protein
VRALRGLLARRLVRIAALLQGVSARLAPLLIARVLALLIILGLGLLLRLLLRHIASGTGFVLIVQLGRVQLNRAVRVRRLALAPRRRRSWSPAPARPPARARCSRPPPPRARPSRVRRRAPRLSRRP